MKNVPQILDILVLRALYTRGIQVSHMSGNTFKFKLVKAEKFLDIRADNTTLTDMLS